MKVAITIVTGAIIGYITNWLAIKMLFRPYEEKRIFGIKVPFTPGLIPKEKTRIAKSVGEAIGNHLLTKETMVESLCSEKINKKLKDWVFNKVDNLNNSQSTVGELLEKISGGNLEKINAYLNKNLTEYILTSIKSEKSKQTIVKYIESYIEENLNKDPKVLTESSTYNNLTEKLEYILLEYKDTGKIQEKLNNTIISEINNLQNTSKKLKEVIPESAISNLKVYMYNKRDEICDSIKDMVNSEKSQMKIKSVISDAIDKNVSPMISMFLNKDSLNEKAMDTFNNFINQEENKNQVIMLIGEILDKILEKNIGDILSNSSEQGKEETAKSIGNLISDKLITKDNIKYLQNTIKDKINCNNNLRDIIINLNETYNKDLNKIINKKLEEFLEGEFFCGKLQCIVESIVNHIFNKKLKDLFCNHKENVSKYSYVIVKNLYNRFIENEAESVIETLDISTITEDKINSFDVAFAEKIILEIASKELSAITWLGALLGGIMGLISALISSL